MAEHLLQLEQFHSGSCKYLRALYLSVYLYMVYLTRLQ